jgi:hypothetical protein
MRTLLTIAMFAGGLMAFDISADSAEAAKKRSVKSRTYATEARPRTREAAECERARHEDPSGSLAGYPCWAREVLSGSKNRSDH